MLDQLRKAEVLSSLILAKSGSLDRAIRLEFLRVVECLYNKERAKVVIHLGTGRLISVNGGSGIQQMLQNAPWSRHNAVRARTEQRS